MAPRLPVLVCEPRHPEILSTERSQAIKQLSIPQDISHDLVHAEASRELLKSVVLECLLEVLPLIGEHIQEEDPILGKKEICELLGISKTTYYKWKRQGIIQVPSVGGQDKIQKSKLLKQVSRPGSKKR